MKHKATVTILILCMFLLTQFVGLYVIASDSVPQFLASEKLDTQSTSFYFYQLITSFIIAILIVSLITKYKLKTVMKTWFLVVIILAISLSLSAIFNNLLKIDAYTFPLLIAIALGFLKVFRPTMIIHNITEILIYPGIATLFVPLLTPIYAILLLIIISIYDMWAVWHSGIMQKMAKFQMEEIKIFGGFMIPYLTQEVRTKLAKLKKSKKKSRKKIKVSMAILGGGDVVFPIITAGVFMIHTGLGYAISVIFGAFLGLSLLLMFSEKKKFYPAMPFISGGIFLGITLCWLLKLFI